MITAVPAFDVGVVKDSFPILLQGAWVTTHVSLVTIVLATVLGTGLALLRRSSNRFVSGLAAGYAWLMRGLPLLVILFIVYYTLPEIGIRVSAYAAAIIGMTMSATAYKGEIIRSGIAAVPQGQMDAAKSVSMPYLGAMRRIVLPQAVRIIVPSYISNAILIVKNSALVSVITVKDLTLEATQLVSSTYKATEIFLTVGVMYLVMTSALMVLQSQSEKYFSRYARKAT